MDTQKSLKDLLLPKAAYRHGKIIEVNLKAWVHDARGYYFDKPFTSSSRFLRFIYDLENDIDMIYDCDQLMAYVKQFREAWVDDLEKDKWGNDICIRYHQELFDNFNISEKDYFETINTKSIIAFTEFHMSEECAEGLVEHLNSGEAYYDGY